MLGHKVHCLLSAMYYAHITLVRSGALYHFCCAHVCSAHATVEASRCRGRAENDYHRQSQASNDRRMRARQTESCGFVEFEVPSSIIMTLVITITMTISLSLSISLSL